MAQSQTTLTQVEQLCPRKKTGVKQGNAAAFVPQLALGPSGMLSKATSVESLDNFNYQNILASERSMQGVEERALADISNTMQQAKPPMPGAQDKAICHEGVG